MKMINKLIHQIAKRNSQSLICYLRKRNCKIGNFVHFHDPKTVFIDINVAHFIEIGNNVSITRNVTILAHDYSYKVLRPIYHDMPQKFGITRIGNNVFIGMNSIVLPGTTIGNNVIVGAGSVVHGNIPDNSVVAGNPAKVICTLEMYHQKLFDTFEISAVSFAKEFYKKKKRYPTIDEMGFYKVLFLEKNEKNKKHFENMNITGDNKTEVINDLMKLENKYQNYEEFIRKTFDE